MLVTHIQFGLFSIILALFLDSQSSMLVTHIQFGLFSIYPCLQSSMLVTHIQFGLFSIYPCLIFRRSVIYACYSYSIWLIFHLSLPYFRKLVIYICYSYPIWLIFHLSLPYFQKVSHFCLLLISNLAYFSFILAIFLASQSSMLVTYIQFGLFSIYPCLIFRRLVIYTCYSYPIWLIFHLFLPYFQWVSHLCLLLISNLAYFPFILALFLEGQSSILVTHIQFGLFSIYPCLIFSGSVIYACYSYPIWLIFHLSLPSFQEVSHLCLLLIFNLAYFPFILALFLVGQSSMLITYIQFGLFFIYPCLILGSQSSMLILPSNLAYFPFILALF